MSDLDARVVVKKSTCFAVLEGNNVIASFVGPLAEENAEDFAKLQKPALHEPCTELEALVALKNSDLATEIYAGRITPMQAAINSVLQGRAKPAPSQFFMELSDKPFADWLDANRGLRVSEVFHEIIKRHRKTLNAIGDVIMQSDECMAKPALQANAAAPVPARAQEEQMPVNNPIDFEIWAKREGLNLAKAKDECSDTEIPHTDKGMGPSTYFKHETETAWRAWANKPSATPPNATKGDEVSDAEVHAAREILGYKSGQVRKMLTNFLQSRTAQGDAEIDLPPLPRPRANVGEVAWCNGPIYTESQMRAYAMAAIRAAQKG